MEYGLHHITSATTTTLIDTNSNRGGISSISICNQHASNVINIDVYLDDGTTLLLDHNLSFDNTVLSLKLVTTGSGLPVSVIVK